MIRWIELATATAPGGETLKLMQRGSEFTITVGGNELMNSRRGGSETALGEIGCAKLKHAAAAHVLIGGLGMGFTLRAALDAVAPEARITVSELVPEVIDWARTAVAHVFMKSLDDPRVTLVKGDVKGLIETARADYDAILLDVDNGADGLVWSSNDDLYSEAGLRAVKQALKPEGVLAVWSASQNSAFRRRLTHSGFTVSEHAKGSGPSKHGLGT